MNKKNIIKLILLVVTLAAITYTWFFYYPALKKECSQTGGVVTKIVGGGWKCVVPIEKQ